MKFMFSFCCEATKHLLNINAFILGFEGLIVNVLYIV